MKNVIKISAIVILTMFNISCEDDDNVVARAVEAPRIVTPNASIDLDAALENNPAFTLVWDHGDYDVDTQINYAIEMALAGSNFDTPIAVGQTTDRFYSWTVGELNNQVLNAGLISNEEGAVELRVKSSIGSNNFEELISESTVITTTPYSNIVIGPLLKNLFLVGNATAADWNNDNNNPPIVRNPANENDYSFKGRFLGGGDFGFKLIEVKGEWQPQWGTNDGSTLEMNDGTGDDPGVFSVAADGYYELTLNTEDRTFSINTYDASGATDYTAIGIGIIGDSTPNGWDDDTDLTQSSFDPHLWFINGVVLGDGEAKFRTNSDWSTNWGGDTELTGYGTQDGPNIPVEAGTYDIWFNDLDGSYVFIAQN